MSLKPLKDWTIGEVVKACGDSECDHCALFADGGCIFGNDESPEYWDEEYIPHIMTFTPQEIEYAKLLQRMFPTATTIARYAQGAGNELTVRYIVKEQPHYATINPDTFPSIAPGTSVMLSEIARVQND